MQKSGVVAVVIGGIVVATAIIVVFVLSQPTEIVNPITVGTDRSYYESGNPATIMVTVHISPKVFTEGKQVELQVLMADRVPYTFAAFNHEQPDQNVTYPLKLAGKASVGGEYFIIASYGKYQAQTSFQYEGFKTSAVTCQEFSLCTYQLTVGSSTYPINFRMNGTIENMTSDMPGKILTIKLQPPQGPASLQIAIPREVVDAKAGADGISGADIELVVFADEIPADNFTEFSTKEGTWAKELGISENPEKYRILVISIEQGTATVDIVGTFPI